MKKKLVVPQFKSLKEEALFWDSHDSTDYDWKETKQVSFSPDLQSVYKKVVPIRLDEETKQGVEKVAKAKGIGTTTAARMLIRERLIELDIVKP